MRRTVALLALAVAVLATPTTAHAHASLVESNPSKGAQLDTLPARVTLTLNETVAEPAFIVVTAPDGTRLEGDVSVEGRAVSATVDPSTAAGAYTVAYRLISADAHTVSGSFEFKVAGAATPSPEPSAGPTPEPTEDAITTTPVADTGTDSLSAVIVIAFFFIALALLFLVIKARMRVGQKTDAD